MTPRKVTVKIVRAVAELSAKGLTSVAIAAKVTLDSSTIRKIRNGSLPMDAACRRAWHEGFAQPKTLVAGQNRYGGGSGQVDAVPLAVNNCDHTPARGSKRGGDTSGASGAVIASMTRFFGAAKKVAAGVSDTPAADSARKGVSTVKREEDDMLLRSEVLRAEARKHFGLPANPFRDDVQTPDDVFITPSVRYVRAALMDAANNHGFVAVVGESGSGKSTLAEDLEERIKAEGKAVIIIRPYVLGMERNDKVGRTLKSAHIAEAVVNALDPNAALKNSPQARFRQIHELLKRSRKAGMRHLLLIEEAHCLPLPTLKHLKRFLELKDGMQRLIGVALVAQPELLEILNSQNAEVREVMQRCDVVEMEPLGDNLEGYLKHKFARFDLAFDQVFAQGAMDAIRARLIYAPRGGRPQDARSLVYPLTVNNLVTRAMNRAALAAYPVVDGDVIKGC